MVFSNLILELSFSEVLFTVKLTLIAYAHAAQGCCYPGHMVVFTSKTTISSLVQSLMQSLTLTCAQHRLKLVISLI